MESSQKEEGLASEESIAAETKKCCSDCKTTKTPLWRSGPSGPKSLCNACGIRYRKKRPTSTAGCGVAAIAAKSELKKGKFGKTKKLNALKVMPMPLVMEEQRRPGHWGEVERAALLLMALSCGAVFA